jgi:hypothetical protein
MLQCMGPFLPPRDISLGTKGGARDDSQCALPSAVIDRRYSLATVTWVLTELAMKQFS